MFLQLLLPGLVLGAIYGLIALGYSLIYKASGLMSFVQGDILTLGAFLGITFYSLLNLSYFVSVLLTILISFFVGVAIERGIIRSLVTKNVMAIYIVLATIALQFVIQNGSQAVWGSLPLYFPSLFGTASIKIGGINFQPEYILVLGVSLVCMVTLHLFMKKSRLGIAMRAAAMDPMAAEACGINVHLTTGITWGISGGLAAVGGILIGPIYGVYTTLGATLGRKGFAGAVIGGYGNMYGAMIGGLILGIVETMVTAYISSAYKNIVAYIILLAFLFLKPTGIFNEKAIKDV